MNYDEAEDSSMTDHDKDVHKLRDAILDWTYCRIFTGIAISMTSE